MLDQKINAAGKAGNDLNASQRAAVTFDGPGPLLVLAGPGSGKTLTITRRIRYLMTEKAVPPEKILVITFTREAALSMRARFFRDSGDIPQQILQTVNFGTFHSIFYQILRQSKGITEKQILSDRDKKKLLFAALSVVAPEKSDQEKTYYAGDLLAAVGFFKNTGDLNRTEQKVPAAFQGVFPRLYEQYERERAAQGKMDFDDMLLDCRTLLAENDEIRMYWQERFLYILIDEFQDINPIQYEVIRLLSGEPHSIFAVGDDDQAIYGFRGSSPACMQKFLEDYHAERILLDTNYRSCGEIVRASLKVIGENKCRFYKDLKAGREERGDEKRGLEAKESAKTDRVAPGREKVRVLGFADQREETAYLLKICGETEDCAVLFRTNRLLQRFAARLKRAKIPFEMREKVRNPYMMDVVLDVMAYLRLGAGEKDQDLLCRIINKPSRYVDREALREMGRSAEPLQFLEAYYRGRKSSVKENIRLLQKQAEALKKMSPYLGLQYVRKVIGYDRWIRERYAGNPREREELEEILDWLGEEAREFQNLQEWMEEQREYREQPASGNGTGSGLKLMTVHASKGLEFRHVILPDCNERIYPYGQMLETDEIEEERRVFYVAMTRAMERLDLLYLTGSRQNPQSRSRFLNVL